MLKQKALLEVTKNDRIYELYVPDNSPLGEVHDVLFQMRSYIIERINEAATKDKPPEPEVKSE